MTHWHPSVLAGLGALLALYLAGIGPLRRRYRLAPAAAVDPASVAAFAGGVLAMGVALSGPLAEWAEHVAAIQRGDIRGMRRWLGATIAGGLIFLSAQVYEFREFLGHDPGLGLTTNLFGTTFYVMVGFHGAHVAVGVLWLLALWVLAGRGRIGERQAVPVDMAGLYWHFVDVVWIFIFTLVYLIQ